MFEDIKTALAAAEQIISALSLEKNRCNDSINYWSNEVNNAIENGSEESSVQWYRSQLAQEEREMEYILKIEKMLVSEVKNAGK